MVAIEDPDPRVAGRGLDQLRAAGIEVVRGVRAEAAHWMTRGHIVRVTERRPFIQLKIAAGADGTIPRGDGGAPVFVTGPVARALGHLMRAEADAILVGMGTVRDDDPDLTCRLPGLSGRSPVRIVLATDVSGFAETRLAATASVVPVQLFVPSATVLEASGLEQLPGSGVEVRTARAVGGRLWLPDVLETLAAQGITRLLVEGGPQIWRAFARHGLYDEVVLFQARPQGQPETDAVARAAAALGRIAQLDNLRLIDHRPLVEDDMFVFHAPAASKARVQPAASQNEEG